MQETGEALFTIFGLGVTKPVITMWVMMGAVTLASILATRNLKEVPGPAQNLAELAVEKLEGFFGNILGAAQTRRYFPVFATLFVFIVIANYTGLLPGAGELFSVPTTSLSVTGGLAVVAFFAIHIIGVRSQGLRGYLRSFLKPFAFLLPLTVIEQAVRPFSLALRLYGNLYGEEKVTEQLSGMFPVILPLVMQVLSLLFCLIQAMVFTMLFAIFVKEATGEEE